MGILKDHIPLITFLRPGLVVINQNNIKTEFFVEDGTVEFVDNNLLILSSSANNIKNLDKSTIHTMLKTSEEKVNNNKITDKDKYLLSYKIDTLKEIN